MLSRIVAYWVYGGALAAVLLLLLLPTISMGWSTLTLVTFLHLPVYMLHQLEEHDQDRFRTFFNQTIGQGYEALSSLAVFVTNVPGVWLLIVVAIYASTSSHPGWALLAVYLVLVNAVVHLVHALLFKRYNPGLATAIILFLPLGGIALWLTAATQTARPLHHAASALLAVVIHAAILMHVRRRLRSLKSGASAASQ